MIFAENGIMPPREWMHNYDTETKYNETLESYLESSDLPVP